MTKSAESHHQKPRSITKSSASFRVTVCCDRSRSAAIDVFILIALIITYDFVFFLFPSFPLFYVFSTAVCVVVKGSAESVYMRRNAAYQAIKR
ncbi:unnamed protein product [Brassica oleracea]|uniref:(rape) hypothetical protein n=1 Tax=Brassica napus TaxID=3708 RepID=A0A816L9A1_BRANA|nr:unnamed protein product [Brassica napus]